VCRGALSVGWRCAGCGVQFDAPDGIPNLRLDGDTRTDCVRRFYDDAPFPGYPPRDDVCAFRARAERSRFVQLLDRAIPSDARIADVGCGTGQLPLYLARADRVVIAADLSRNALKLGRAAACRYGIDQVQFVETDLHQPALARETFDVVYSSGVLHHTPDPRAAFAQVARLARAGGIIVVGLYNAFGRLPLRLRRAVTRLTRFRVIPFDPIWQQRQSEPARARAWLRDQYRHPEEHSHTVGEVKRWFQENGVEFLRTFPSTALDDEGDLFSPSVDDWTIENWIAQLEWMWTLGGEGGLFFTIGRRFVR
jgi:SAM-dependent methyltransferase